MNNLDQFLKAFDDGAIAFPLKRDTRSDVEIHEMMSKLKSYDVKGRFITVPDYQVRPLKITKSFRGEVKLLLNHPADYDDFNILSDMFMEEQRMRCRFVTCAYSPYEYFHKFPRKVGEMCLSQFGIIDGPNLIETRWKIPEARECTSFRPSNMLAMMQILYPEGQISILDPSSGWGDRLIAAIAADSEYVGVDPNVNLKEGYAAIIDFFKYKLAEMHPIRFEDFKSDRLFDLVFTSPPYFTMETYDAGPAAAYLQSTAGKNGSFRSEAAWVSEFLFPYLDKAWKFLKKGGYAVYVINMAPGQTYIYKMLDHMRAKRDCVYTGVLPYAEKDKFMKAQPMFVFQKLGGSQSAPQSASQPAPQSAASMRKFRPTDVDAMFRIQSDPANMKYVASGKTKTLDQVKEQIARYIAEYDNPTYGEFYAIVDSKDDLIGYIGHYSGDFTHPYLRGKRFIRILIDKAYQERGVGKKIVRDFYDKFGRQREILAMVEESNVPSNKLFQHRGLKKHIAFRGKSYNIY